MGASSIFFGLLAVGWFCLTLRALYDIRSIPQLPESDPGSFDEPPRVSVVVSARDEQSRIETTVTHLLELRDVDAEIIVVDDRSTDGTTAILQRLAEEHPRLQLLRVDVLPEGWLGKTHACHLASRAASGEWILFSDADAWIRPDVVARAVRAAQRDGADHLCLLPGEPEVTVPGKASLLFFSICFVSYAGRVNRDLVRAYIGIGAFNLVRAEAYRSFGGHEALRLEVVDDLKLGFLLKRHGFRSRIYSGAEDVEIHWASSLRGLIRAVDKNFFAMAGYNLPLVLLALTGSLAVWAGSLAGPFTATAAGIAAGLGLLSLSLPAAVLSIRAGWGLLPALLVPVFLPVLSIALGLSTLKTLRQGGICWRDTFYPLDRLRKGVVR